MKKRKKGKIEFETVYKTLLKKWGSPGRGHAT